MNDTKTKQNIEPKRRKKTKKTKNSRKLQSDDREKWENTYRFRIAFAFWIDVGPQNCSHQRERASFVSFIWCGLCSSDWFSPFILFISLPRNLVMMYWFVHFPYPIIPFWHGFNCYRPKFKLFSLSLNTITKMIAAPTSSFYNEMCSLDAEVWTYLIIPMTEMISNLQNCMKW